MGGPSPSGSVTHLKSAENGPFTGAAGSATAGSGGGEGVPMSAMPPPYNVKHSSTTNHPTPPPNHTPHHPPPAPPTRERSFFHPRCQTPGQQHGGTAGIAEPPYAVAQIIDAVAALDAKREAHLLPQPVLVQDQRCPILPFHC